MGTREVLGTLRDARCAAERTMRAARVTPGTGDPPRTGVVARGGPSGMAYAVAWLPSMNDARPSSSSWASSSLSSTIG